MFLVIKMNTRISNPLSTYLCIMATSFGASPILKIIMLTFVIPTRNNLHWCTLSFTYIHIFSKKVITLCAGILFSNTGIM